MFRLISFFAALCVMNTAVVAIVIRDDVDETSYLLAKGHPALVEMRHQGHGMLIAPEWVVTAAHLIFYDYRGKTITLGGKEREIAHVIFHPGYAKPPTGIFSGYSGPSQAYLRGNHDLALIKLAEPVTDIRPISLYGGAGEVGQIVQLQGRGNTGTGITGQKQKTGGTLRQAENKITAAQDQWLYYRMDQGAEALPLEGIQGDGDSGGPAILRDGGADYLAGLVSWDVYDGDIADFRGGLYGMDAALVRVSYYRDWIAGVQAWPEDRLAAGHQKVGYGKAK